MGRPQIWLIAADLGAPGVACDATENIEADHFEDIVGGAATAMVRAPSDASRACGAAWR
jgi:hypothetical protein